VGFARKPPVFLKPGDRMEVSIDRIGALGNPVVASSASRHQTPQAVGPSGETIPFA
jgi:fumarylacetoacetate (FAA) hydrolase family protein